MNEAPTATVEAPAAAPVEAGQPAPTPPQAPATPPTPPQPTPEEPKPPVEEPKFDYVPSKFLKDGKPDFEKLSKSYIDLEKKIGHKVPVADPAEYEYDFGEREIDEEASNAFRENAAKMGFNKEQYKFLVETHMNLVDNIQWTGPKAVEALKKDWGEEFDTNIKSAQAAFEAYAPSELDINDPAFNNPTILKLLARIGKEMGEDENVKSTGSISGRQSIDDEIAELRKLKIDELYTEANQKKLIDLYQRREKAK